MVVVLKLVSKSLFVLYGGVAGILLESEEGAKEGSKEEVGVQESSSGNDDGIAGTKEGDKEKVGVQESTSGNQDGTVDVGGLSLELEQAVGIGESSSNDPNGEDELDDLPLGFEAEGADRSDDGDDGSDAGSVDGGSTVVHDYFLEKTPSVVPENIDALSEATSTAPAVRPLPSGKCWGVECDVSTIFTRVSQKDVAGSSSSISAPDGLNDLLVACKSGDAGLVRAILKRGDVDVNKGSQGLDSVSAQRRLGEKRSTGYVTEGKTPLIIASKEGNVSVVKELLACPEIDVNKQDGTDDWEKYNDDDSLPVYGNTALYFACWKGHVQVVQLLLARPEIDVNLAGGAGFTPFKEACAEGHLEVVQILLDHPNIDVNKEDGSPLWWAILYNQTQVAELLLAHKNIDVSKLDYDNPNFERALQRHPHIAKIIRKHPTYKKSSKCSIQ